MSRGRNMGVMLSHEKVLFYALLSCIARLNSIAYGLSRKNSYLSPALTFRSGKTSLLSFAFLMALSLGSQSNGHETVDVSSMFHFGKLRHQINDLFQSLMNLIFISFIF
jgi:hypothetical protein